MNTTTKIGLVLLGVVLLLCRFFLDLYSAATNGLQPNIANDAITHGWPFLSYAHASIQSGSLPLWNPYTSLGTPFLAEIGLGLFFPLAWVVLFMDVAVGLVVIQFLTVLVTMAGMYCYMRFLGLAPVARLLGVTLCAYAAFTETFYPTMGYSFCLMPFILWLCHRMMDHPDLRNACWLALAIALCFLGGFPNYFVYTAIVAGLYCASLLLFSLPNIRFPGVVARAAMVFVVVILALALVAVQLLPSYELSSLTYRDIDAGTAYDASSFWEIFSLELLLENFVRTGNGFLFGNKLFQVSSGIFYLGGALLFLPFAFTGERNRRTAIALGVAFIALCLFLLSYHAPALAFIQKLPFVSAIRVNGRAAGYVQFLLVIILSIGFSNLVEQARQKQGVPDKSRLAAGVSFFMVYALWLGHTALEANDSVRYLVGFLACGLWAILAMSAGPGSKRTTTLAWLMALLVLVDVSVLRSHRFQVPAFAPPEAGYVQSGIEQLRENPDHYRVVFRETGFSQAALLANTGPKYQVPSIDAYMGLTSARWENYVRHRLGPEKFDSLVSQTYLQRFYGYFSRPLLNSALRTPGVLELASLKYVVSETGISETDKPLPRAYAVADYLTSTSEEQSLAAIKEHSASLLESSVVLENGQPTFPPRPMAETAGDVVIERYSANEVVLSANLQQPSMVVLTDAWYPGWEATVDGNEVSIFRANSLFRAVEVPAGAHTVVYRYRPTSVYLGFWITLIALLAIVIFLFRSRVKPR